MRFVVKVVIIGGGAAGASCAARLRRLDENAEVLILEKTNEISIANCGLPYYISDVIDDNHAGADWKEYYSYLKKSNSLTFYWDKELCKKNNDIKNLFYLPHFQIILYLHLQFLPKYLF